MNDFLKKMQKALVTGEKDAELNEYLNALENKANKIPDAQKAVENRLAMAGETDVDHKKLVEIEEYNKKAMEEIKKEDEKLATLAIIENMKSELNKLKKDYEDLKAKYEKNITDISENIEKSEKEYVEIYGAVVEQKSGFDVIKDNYEKNL